MHPPVSRDGLQLIEWNRRARHIVVREVIVCRVMSGPIESSDDDVSQRVAQAACDSDTSGSDHAVDDEDGSDSEVSMRCEFVDSMPPDHAVCNRTKAPPARTRMPAQRISSVFFN